MEARLNATETQLQDLKRQNTALEARLNTTERLLEELKSKNRSSVAFSASLVQSGETFRGPFSSDTTLVYKNVFTNIGKAYCPNTGVFTAPLRGVYYFSFSTFGYGSRLSGAVLVKNGRRVVSSYDHKSSDSSDGGGNAAVLHLEAGEQVYMHLWADAQVFDNLNGHTTFSGFLLFPG
ncbi:complement C1q-like protein 2 [Megalops cyprinoides]|uniref:complement C1q-like protein 2 n=1 Tax=Megalops cyprinoides TaxID=118141 RepID=UPI001863FD89|nr:complement C1q-like protein 2 [Megalops cyprinoides]